MCPSLAERAVLNPSEYPSFSVIASGCGIPLEEAPSLEKAFLPSQFLAETHARCFVTA
jgi:hypothetical protein